MTDEKRVYTRDFILGIFSPDHQPPATYVPIEKLFDLAEGDKDAAVIYLEIFNRLVSWILGCSI